jgi:hypothetical protein
MYEQLIQQVTQAINHAPDGDIIDGSKRQVYDLMNQFEQRLYQAALQQRIATAQADFSPSHPS